MQMTFIMPLYHSLDLSFGLLYRHNDISIKTWSLEDMAPDTQEKLQFTSCISKPTDLLRFTYNKNYSLKQVNLDTYKTILKSNKNMCSKQNLKSKEQSIVSFQSKTIGKLVSSIECTFFPMSNATRTPFLPLLLSYTFKQHLLSPLDL